MRSLPPRRPWLALAFASAVLPGCYTMRIDESYWLRPRPGPGPDTAQLSSGLPPLARLTAVHIAGSGEGVLSGIMVARPDAEATVLFFGGDNFRLAPSGAEVVRSIGGAARVNLLVMDYAGYGESEGSPTLARIQSDALVIHDWARGHAELGDAPIIVHGHSMGSFVAASLADARPVHGLVLQSSATTVPDWTRSFFRPSRFKWWARLAYPFIRISVDPALDAQDNLARVGRYRGPLLLLVGADDDVTPAAMSRALYEASATPESSRMLVVLPDAGHDDVLTQPGFPAAYASFVELVRAGSGPPD